MLENLSIDQNNDNLINPEEIQDLKDILNDPNTKTELIEGLDSDQGLKATTRYTFENTIQKISRGVSKLSSSKQTQVINSYNTLFPQETEGKIDKQFKKDYKECDEGVTEQLLKFSSVDNFNIGEFRAKLIYPLAEILSNEKIPVYVKENLITDFKNNLKEISKIPLSRIDDLRGNREKMSFGTSNNSDGELLNILIGQQFGNSIAKKADIINRCFVDETENMGKTEYHKKTLDNLRNNFGELDQKYGLNISSIIRSGIENMSSDSILLSRLINKLEPNKEKRKILKNNFARQDELGLNKDDFKIENGEHTIYLFDILEEYKRPLLEFKKGQNTNYTELKKDILDIGNEKVEGKVEDWFGLEKIDSNIELENEFEKKVNSMKGEDLIILLNQLAGIAPIYGGVQDLATVYYGVEADGHLPGGFELAFLGITGALDITGIGSVFAKIAKVEKIAKFKKMLKTVLTVLSREDKISFQHFNKCYFFILYSQI